MNWAEARPEFSKFLSQYEPVGKIKVSEMLNVGLPPWKTDGFTEEVLYLTIDFDSVTKRNLNNSFNFCWISYKCFY